MKLMTLRFNTRALVAIVAFALIVAACSGDDSESATVSPGDDAGVATSAPSDEKFDIGISELFANPFFAEARKAFKETAEGTNLVLNIQNADADVSKEAEIVRTFITQEVDLIIISPVSPDGSVATIKSAADAGIPVLCYGTCINDADAALYTIGFVASDNVGLGRTTGAEAAKYVAESLGGSAKILMLTCETFATCQDRRTGFDSQLAEFDITLLDEQEGYLVDEATPIAQAMVRANPDADFVFAQNEDAIIAAHTAISSQGLGDTMKVFGVDINTQVASLIASGDGIVIWTTGQAPYTQGKRSIEIALEYLTTGGTPWFREIAPGSTLSAGDPAAAQEYVDTHE